MRDIRFSMKCSCIQVRTNKGGCRSRRRNPCFRGGKEAGVLVSPFPRPNGRRSGADICRAGANTPVLRVVVAYGLLRTAPAGQTPVKPRLQNTYGIFYALNSIYSPKTFLLFAWRHSVLLFWVLLWLVFMRTPPQARRVSIGTVLKTMTQGVATLEEAAG